MDKNVEWLKQTMVNRTIVNLNKHNINAYSVRNKEEVIDKIMEILGEDKVVSTGGSMTLFETGVIDHLRSCGVNFLDRYQPGLTPEDIKENFLSSLRADLYLTSTNALTEEGELYNVDRNGNRVAAMVYGPKKVVVVAGVNKIVKDIPAAVERNRRVAAPANAKRLNLDTSCAKTGYCVDCNSPARICHSYVTISRQFVADRMHVIIVDGEWGY